MKIVNIEEVDNKDVKCANCNAKLLENLEVIHATNYGVVCSLCWFNFDLNNPKSE